jgi:general transcription factor 3C polypeptide 3 (transcription factor C subunit 4)
MILLSVGQCYIHYALKRQSENRQYLLIQGFVFLHQYYDLKASSADAAERQEAHYNMARSYHAIGIPHLAAEFYQRVLRDVPDDYGPSVLGRNDLSQEAAYNLQQICWAGGDLEAVKGLSQKYLTL